MRQNKRVSGLKKPPQAYHRLRRRVYTAKQMPATNAGETAKEKAEPGTRIASRLSLVEATGLEPAASCSQSKHSTKLSYASKSYMFLSGARFPTALGAHKGVGPQTRFCIMLQPLVHPLYNAKRQNLLQAAVPRETACLKDKPLPKKDDIRQGVQPAPGPNH